MSLIYKLEEQFGIGFTGKLNVLNRKDGRFMGDVLLKEGSIVDCHYGEREGQRGLLYLVVSDVVSEYDFEFVIEPEMIADSDKYISFDYVKKRASQIVREFSLSEKLRPPSHLKLLVDANFVLSGAALDLREFQALCAISDFAKVEDVYTALDFHEYEVTGALVSLRKKKAVKVIG